MRLALKNHPACNTHVEYTPSGRVHRVSRHLFLIPPALLLFPTYTDEVIFIEGLRMKRSANAKNKNILQTRYYTRLVILLNDYGKRKIFLTLYCKCFKAFISRPLRANVQISVCVAVANNGRRIYFSGK